MTVNVETNVIVGNDAAVAQVKVSLPGFDSRTYTGTSKKHPKDVTNYSIGESLALARALRKAAEDLEFQATVRVEFEATRRSFLSPFQLGE